MKYVSYRLREINDFDFDFDFERESARERFLLQFALDPEIYLFYWRIIVNLMS